MMIKRIPLAALFTLLFILSVVPLNQSARSDEGSTYDIQVIGRDVIDVEVPPLRMLEKEMEGRMWSTIEMEGTIYPPSDGGPCVPYLSNPLKVGYEIEDISVVRGDPITFRIPLHLAPSPKAVHLTSDVFESGSPSPLDLDWSKYTNGDSYPEDKIRWAHIGYGWDTGERRSHYSVSICPFDYDPVEGTLILYRDIDLLVERSDPTNLDSSLAMTRAVERPSLVAEGTELLVIAYDPFVNDLEDYVQWKREKGLTVSIVKYSLVNGAYSSLGGAQSIREYIHDTYFGDGKNLKWVLLAGEPKYVPTLMAWDQDPYMGEPQTLPADTYFACLDGNYDDWDRDGDGRWAETNDVLDAVPDVYVSRVSTDTDVETFNWGKKVIGYEKNPSIGDWTSKVLLLGSTTHEYDDGPKQCEYFWNTYMDDVYSTPVKLYSSGNVQQNVGATVISSTSVKSSINSGVSTVVYMGHGYHQMWTAGTQNNPTYLLQTSDANGFSQSPKLPFITAMSCETNWYDAGSMECIAEGFIENPNGGAIGYVGASRTTEGGIGYYQYMPGAPGLQEDFLRMMNQGIRSQAEIFHEGKANYYDEWGSWFNSYQFAYNAWVEHNILGSPETEIWSNSISTFTVSVDYEMDYYSNFTVNVKDGSGNVVPGATVTIYSDKLGLGSVGTTDPSGNVKIPFRISEAAYGKVTVTKRNFKPFQKEYYLNDDTDPVTTVHFGIPDPDGSSGWYRSDPDITFTSTEPAEINYRWNGGSDEEFKGSILVPKGENTLEYWAEDLSGNEEGMRSEVIRYDPDTPVLEYTMTPVEPDGLNDWFITLPVITTEINGIKASSHQVDYWWGRGTKQVSNGTIYAMQGENQIHLQAVDEAGNKDDEITIDLRVDSICPFTEINTGGEEPNSLGWYVSPMAIELTCSDRSAETFYKWGEDEDWIRYRDIIEPPQGNYTFYYYSEDSHGNKEHTGTLSVPYDLIEPKITADILPSTPDGSLGWHVSSPTLKLSTETPSPYDVIYYRMDAGYVEVYSGTITIPEGEHSIYAYAIDQAGNRGPTKDYHFKVDTRDEKTDLSMDSSPNDEGWITDVPMIFLSSSEGTIIYYSWDHSQDHHAYNGGILPPGEEGEFVLTYYAVDPAGNHEKVRTITFYIDAKGPQTIITGPVETDAGVEVTFDLSQTTDGSDVEAYFVDFGDGSNSGWVSSPKVAHSYNNGGTYTVTARARDGVGHESKDETLTIVVTEDASNSLLLIIFIGISVLVVLSVGLFIVLEVAKKKEDHRHPPHLHPMAMHHHAHLNSGIRSGHIQPHPNRPVLPRAPAPVSSAPKPVGNVKPPVNTVQGQPPVKQTMPQQNRQPTVPPPPKMPDIPQPPRPPI